MKNVLQCGVVSCRTWWHHKCAAVKSADQCLLWICPKCSDEELLNTDIDEQAEPSSDLVEQFGPSSDLSEQAVLSSDVVEEIGQSSGLGEQSGPSSDRGVGVIARTQLDDEAA